MASALFLRATPRTRADQIGVNVRRLRRITEARVISARSALAEIALYWSDVDGGVAFDAERLISRLDAFVLGSVVEGLHLLSGDPE